MTRRFALELVKAVSLILVGGIVIALTVIALFPSTQPYYSTMAERRSSTLVEPTIPNK